MPYSVELSRDAQRSLDALPAREAARMVQALWRLAEDPRPGGVVKLRGTAAPLWRLRIGSYRAIYTVSDQARRVIVVRIGSRSERTYKGL